MKKNHLLRKIFVLSSFSPLFFSAQNVGINATGATPNASAMLDVVSTSKGMLIPRVALTSNADAATITSGNITSLLVYNTTAASAGSTAVFPGYYYWNGVKWVALGGAGGLDWALLGNAGTTASSAAIGTAVNNNFLGTTDNTSLVFATNNLERMRILNSGNVGISQVSPGAKLSFNDLNDGTNGADGITWYSPSPLTYGIYRTAGAWSAPNYQQLKLSWDVGVIIDGGSAYGLSGTLLQPTAGNVAVGQNLKGAYNLEVNGTFGFGNGTAGTYRSRTETRDNAGLQGNAGAQSGFYETSNPSNYPAGATSWWHLIDVRHSNSGNNYALQISGSFFDQDLYYRKTNSNGAQAWTRFLTSANLTCATVNFVPKMTTTTNMGCSQIYDDGTNVGIGTTSPQTKLTVLGDGVGVANIGGGFCGGNYTGISLNGLVGGCGTYNILSSPTDQNLYLNRTAGNTMRFRENNADQMTIISGGYVGINTTTPTSRLHVVSDGDNIPVIYGINTNTTAGTTSYGIRGECNATGLGSAGVSGVSTNSGQNEIGVAGDYALWGASVFGLAWASAYTDMPATRDFGVFATCNFNTGTGVYARDMNNAAGSYAFYGTGKFAVTGAKAASVPTTKGNQLLYCQESPEMWFEDIGSSKLVNGQVEITLDELYLETVFIDASHPMQVFLQENGESNGLIVIKENGKFLVKEKNGGTSNIEFSYRVLAKRRFYQDHRFGVDSNQPFEDNLKNAKDVEPLTRDPQVMKAFVEAATRQKEAEYAAKKAAENLKKTT
ncbi:MAG: hypothetical protein IAF38_22615, partial [Bacteroidia bacterium]|nr:hypothetical protein [Bacteroidia bacterium]